MSLKQSLSRAQKLVHFKALQWSPSLSTHTYVGVMDCGLFYLCIYLVLVGWTILPIEFLQRLITTKFEYRAYLPRVSVHPLFSGYEMRVSHPELI